MYQQGHLRHQHALPRCGLGGGGLCNEWGLRARRRAPGRHRRVPEYAQVARRCRRTFADAAVAPGARCVRADIVGEFNATRSARDRELIQDILEDLYPASACTQVVSTISAGGSPGPARAPPRGVRCSREARPGVRPTASRRSVRRVHALDEQRDSAGTRCPDTGLLPPARARDVGCVGPRPARGERGRRRDDREFGTPPYGYYDELEGRGHPTVVTTVARLLVRAQRGRAVGPHRRAVRRPAGIVARRRAPSSRTVPRRSRPENDREEYPAVEGAKGELGEDPLLTAPIRPPAPKIRGPSKTASRARPVRTRPTPTWWPLSAA